MESGEGREGMVAVVRGLKHSGLAVTLLDGNKQYTLMPNAAPSPPTSKMRSKHDVASQQYETFDVEPLSMCDSGAQATDGRYASMYKMAHCRVSPTSPPVELTEFPPQRPEINRGEGNFQVGGCGSGESYSPCRSNGSFRGGMCWPDRGSVCSPRQSREPDAFANSLRKYPNVSAERSTELVERLINYTQAKHSKSYQNRYPSPTRQGPEYNMPGQLSDRSCSRNVHRSPSYQRNHELDSNSRIRYRLEESPTRDLRAKSGISEYEYGDYRKSRNVEPKYANDSSKRIGDSFRTMTSNSYTQNFAVTKDLYDTTPYALRTASMLSASKSVNMEVQAAVQMVSREVATQPRITPMQRINKTQVEISSQVQLEKDANTCNEYIIPGHLYLRRDLNLSVVPEYGPKVAVSLSLVPSNEEQKLKGEVSIQVEPIPITKPALSYKYVQAAVEGEDLSVQANTSSIELTNKRKNHCQCLSLNKKSKSEEQITSQDLEGELMNLLERVSISPSVDPKASDLRQKVLKTMSYKLRKLSQNLQSQDDEERVKVQIEKMLKYVPVWVPYGDVQAYRDAISEEIIGTIRQFKAVTRVYRTEVPAFQIGTPPHDLKNIIRDWIKNLPIKSYQAFGIPADKSHMINKYVNRIHRMILRKIKDVTNDDLRTELLNFTNKIPMNIHTSHKFNYLNQIITTLLNKIHKVVGQLNRNYVTYNFQTKTLEDKSKNNIETTEAKLKAIIKNPLKDLLHNTTAICNDRYIKYVETELIDIIMESAQDIYSGKDTDVAEEIVLLLRENDIINENQARSFVNQLLVPIKELLTTENTNYNYCSNTQARNYVVLQNTSNADRDDRQITKDKTVDSDAKDYLDKLTQQIDEWLQNSKISIPLAQDKGFKQVVIHDLADDIVDRHKYLELNPSSRGSDEDELEHLKYQIFKWINKLAGEENMETLEHAPELMHRIHSLPVPVFSQQQNIPESQALANGCSMSDCPQTMKNTQNNHRISDQVISNQNMANKILPNRRMSNGCQRKSSIRRSLTEIPPKPHNVSSPCCNGTLAQQYTPSLKQLNEEYDEYLKNWVNEVPIPTSTPDELALAEKARLGIYNGVWKALTKLKLDPAIFHNVFYYEDALDEELEELLKCLPDTPEMKAKKHLLKVKLIEKTTNTNQMISNTAAPASFRHHLVENVENDLPTKPKLANNNNDSNRPFDEIQVQKLIDDYILCTKFKESDESKAEVYRKKLIKEAHSIIENIKKTRGTQSKGIDTDLYVNNILNALHKVPLPTSEVLEEEANEIEISQEVDMWLADLQVIHKENNIDQQQMNKQKDALVKKILELQKTVNILDCSGGKFLKHEISLFLDKVSIQGENVNLDFIAEEFVNRLKNKSKESQAGFSRRKSVDFLDSVGYYEFSLQMPGCSSFSEMPLHPPLIDQSSYMIKDGKIEKMPPPRFLQYGSEKSPYEIPSNEYLTLQDSQAPKKPQPVSRPLIVSDGLAQNPPVSDFQPPPQINKCCQLAGNSQNEDKFQQQQTIQRDQPIPNDILTNSVSRINQTFDQGTVDAVTQTTEPKSCCARNNRELNVLPMSDQPTYVENMRNASAMPAPTLLDPHVGQKNTNGVEPCCQGFREFNNAVNTSRKPSYPEPIPNTHQGIPIVIEGPNRSASYQTFEHPFNQASTDLLHRGSRNLPGTMLSYGQPQGFSTPQYQIINQDLPLRPDRKRSRRQQGHLGNFAKRRLDLDEESDNASEKDEPCPCLNRMWRCRREPICYTYEDFGMDRPECYPYPYSCPHFY